MASEDSRRRGTRPARPPPAHWRSPRSSSEAKPAQRLRSGRRIDELPPGDKIHASPHAQAPPRTDSQRELEGTCIVRTPKESVMPKVPLPATPVNKLSRRIRQGFLM